MAMKVVAVFKNGMNSDGKIIPAESSLSNFLSSAGTALKIEAKKAFSMSGVEITGTNCLDHNDIIYVSTGDESFIKNEFTSNSEKAPKEKITLNVGGQQFVTSRSTLSRDPDCKLAKMFSCKHKNGTYIFCKKDENGAYLIDRNPIYFEIILNYLRTSQIIIGKDVSLRRLLEEARYFGLKAMIHDLENILFAHSSLSGREIISFILKANEQERSEIDQLNCEGICLAGADLSGLNLSRINFRNADLSECRIVKTDVANSCFDFVNLKNTVLENIYFDANIRMRSANLEGAEFENCVLHHVKLDFALLKNTSFRRCRILHCCFEDADIQDCRFVECKIHGMDPRTVLNQEREVVEKKPRLEELVLL